VQDLNDLLFFTAVVEQAGFSAAGRVLNLPKSSVSRHVARLEARLGVRLLERSTRKLRVTEVGKEYYSRCRAILADLIWPIGMSVSIGPASRHHSGQLSDRHCAIWACLYRARLYGALPPCPCPDSRHQPAD